MKFLDLGTITATAAAQLFPRGDGAPQAVGATSITLPTSAVEASNALGFYAGYGVLVIAGQGAGQLRQILTSSTAYLCTVPTWDSPRPDTGSTIVVGLLPRGRDGVAVKFEGTSSVGTGTYRGVFYTNDPPGITTSRIGNARAAVSTSWTPGGTVITSHISSSASLQLESRSITAIGEDYVLAKVGCEVAPTANVECFAAPQNTRGRMGQF